MDKPKTKVASIGKSVSLLLLTLFLSGVAVAQNKMDVNKTAKATAKKEAIWNRNDVALLIIDYQPELLDGVHSGGEKLIETNVVYLTKIAKAFKIPVVLSTVGVNYGVNKPTLESIKKEVPDVKEIDRTSMASFQDKIFLAAVEKTGKKKLVIVGLWTEICLTFAVVDALASGYEVMILTDAVGGRTPEAHQMSIERMVQAGAIPNTTFAFTGEMNPDWADPAGQTLKALGGAYIIELAKINSGK